MKKNTSGLITPAVSGDELIESIPALQEIAVIETQQFANIPSAQMSPQYCLQLRQQIINDLLDYDIIGIVIVHGTDTIEETAFFLDATLSSQQLNEKIIILTGAMRNADEEHGDGPGNLLSSVITAVSTQAKNRGVLVVMNNKIHQARWIQKVQSHKTDAFMSPNAPENSLGSIKDSTHIFFNKISQVSRPLPTIDIKENPTEIPRVDIINMHSGADNVLLSASINAGAKAIVINAVGAGNVNIELYEAIKTALEQDIAVIICTRTPFGSSLPLYGYFGGGRTLLDAGACFSHDLPAQKARIYAQMLLIQKVNTSNSNISTLQKGFSKLTQKQL